MSNRFSCALNGVSPESLDSAIRVTDLTVLPPVTRVVTAPTLRHGLRLLRRVRESLTVRVSFVIAEHDPARRRELLSRLHAWADPGGMLTVSDCPGQRLSVVCDTLPMLSALCWTDEIQLEFTAYSVPFWEFEEETSIATSGHATLLLPGTADECPVSVLVANTGADALTTLTLHCGDTQMTFEDLSLAPGSVFTLQVEEGLLRADADGASALMHRSGMSSDFLLADCGTPADVSVSADQPVSAVFHARGRLL